MLNYRKLKKDFSPAIVKEGRDFYDRKMVSSAKIVNLTAGAVRLSCEAIGNFNHTYECEIEIDRQESTIIDSDCDCTYKYDCQHLAAVIFYLEEHLDELVVAYSKEANIDCSCVMDANEKKTLEQTFQEAVSKDTARKDKKQQKELLEEYVRASEILGQSPFFLSEEDVPQDRAELLLILSEPLAAEGDTPPLYEIQLALRLPYRSKPLNVPNIREFLDAIRYNERVVFSNKRFHFTISSFDRGSAQTLKLVLDHARFPDAKGGRNPRTACLDAEAVGTVLAQACENALEQSAALHMSMHAQERENRPLPGLYCRSLEEPLCFSSQYALLRVELEHVASPAPKLLLNPKIVIEDKIVSIVDDVRMFECAKPGLMYRNTYYRFEALIRRRHLRNLSQIRDMTIPEPLFGTFVENSLPELSRFAEVANQELMETFVTLPFTGELKAECDISYLNGELEASLYFIYDNIKVPGASSALAPEDIESFVTSEGILARNLTGERKIVEGLFEDFIFEPKTGVYVAKSEKKIVEFMTEVVPQNQHRVKFNCPENLLDQFLYDETTFKLSLNETKRVDVYQVDLTVDGYLSGATVDMLWECLSSRRSFIELDRIRETSKKKKNQRMGKILVLDLERTAAVVQIFDELGLNKLDNHTEERPLWSLASIDSSQFEGLPVKFSMSPKLTQIQQQMLGAQSYEPRQIPKDIQASIREYQRAGIGWLERLREMHLNGILADDMGLGKTLQAIVSITQYKQDHHKAISLIVCPTSLIYNWKEEFGKFNSKLKILPVDGTPSHRKKLLDSAKKYDVLVTSYSLLQKDIDIYKEISLGYVILDEAQHIKNRTTQNAKSVKMLQCDHRIILTGTPIENSLDELWSLFDFLMPGLLSTYDRFVEKYVRAPVQSPNGKSHLETLRRKLSPFILRRMKKDVLSELPPVTEIVYHCHLSDTQRELYRSYAQTAREELSQLVKKEGFDKVQIHVLATLTRLKQICCHPAIFAKEKPEFGDSAKYEMLMELLQTLIEGKHKSVIFSQYTRMLQIIKKDMQNLGVRFEYLDGSTKNRMSIVKKFNEDENIPVFLVSLKAGGSGLNLVGADTVIHYDMWWNPAVQMQATDRVHRIGQQNSVSSYTLVTLDTIEEKIIKLQERKKGLVKKIINTDEEAIEKLTWEEVLELLQT